MLFVQHNLLAENANRQLKVSTGKNAKTTEKLSSGYRINRAADDAAGLSISEKMRRQVRGLHQTVDNISEGVGYVQTAEGALNEVHDMLQRMNELAVKAANGTNTAEDRAYIDSEVQALKSEMDRIFRTTTFNERKIWEPGDKKLLGYQTVEAVDDRYTGNSMTITNKNYAVLPGGYLYHPSIPSCLSASSSSMGLSSYSGGDFYISADINDGISVKWTGYNGNDYETDRISWEQLKEQNYRFEMSTLFNQGKYPELFDGGQPVFTHEVAFAPAETATVQDMVDCLNGRSMDADARVTLNGVWKNKTGSNANFEIVDRVLYYPAAYASRAEKDKGNSSNGHDFDVNDDAILEPSGSGNTNLTKCPVYIDAEDAKTNTGTWEFSFDMTGLGKVIATSDSVSYWSDDQTEDHEGLWWHWHIVTENGVEKYRYKQQIVKPAAGTLAGVMSALTGNEQDATPGLLKKDGCNDGTKGVIEINFSLNIDPTLPEFQYTGANKAAMSSREVGRFSLKIPVSATDSEDAIFDKIQNALNGNSILDFSTSANSDNVSFYSLYPSYKGIPSPIYGGVCGFYVQAGTEGGQHISVQYESLSTIVLGLEHTNTRTQESAGRAINEIKGALQMVSEQRSTFGAYQNRIEHARNINANVEENTQAAESRIRDADIADLMMEYSINNILMQAGTSMLTQANQSSQSILELLQ